MQKKKTQKWWLEGNQQGLHHPHTQSPPNLLILPPKELSDSSAFLLLLYHNCTQLQSSPAGTTAVAYQLAYLSTPWSPHLF